MQLVCIRISWIGVDLEPNSGAEIGPPWPKFLSVTLKLVAILLSSSPLIWKLRAGPRGGTLVLMRPEVLVTQLSASWRARRRSSCSGARLKLTRFRGHPRICVEGVHDAKQGKEASTIPA